jgi:hypothetical protein
MTERTAQNALCPDLCVEERLNLSFSRRKLLASATMIGTAYPVAAAAETPKRPLNTPQMWARTELYFGTSKPNNQQVTEAEFDDFVESVVTSRFPDGLTLLTGYGQFRSSTGELTREKSYLLILFYSPEMQDANTRIQEVRDQYRLRFTQESVLRVDGFSCISML